MAGEDTLLVKFGQLQHLEMLLNGTLYLNPISKYRKDETSFRGDINEGVTPINPLTIKIFDKDGNDIFNKIPRPSSVKASYVGDDDLLMFCASIINRETMELKENNIYILSEKYKKAMENFGEYALTFWKSEFLNLLNKAVESSVPRFGYTSGPIIYRDLNDFNNEDNYKRAYNSTGSVLDAYFVKSINYLNQNEWRLIIDGSDGKLPTNDDGSYIINIGKMQNTKILDTKTLFDKLTCSM